MDGKLPTLLSRALVLTAVALIFTLRTGVVLIHIGIALAVTIIIAVVVLLAAPVGGYGTDLARQTNP